MQHHMTLSTALVIVLVLLIITEFFKTRSGAGSLSPTQLIQLINHENAAVVDIRSSEAFMNGHVIGAVSIPLRDLLPGNRALEKLKPRQIVLLCANGQESARAATTLKKQGFQTYALSGGMRAWTEADMPVVKS